MPTEEQLVNCVRHTRGFIQTYFASIDKAFFKKSIFKGYFKKAVISSYSIPEMIYSVE